MNDPLMEYGVSNTKVTNLSPEVCTEINVSLGINNNSAGNRENSYEDDNEHIWNNSLQTVVRTYNKRNLIVEFPSDNKEAKATINTNNLSDDSKIKMTTSLLRSNNSVSCILPPKDITALLGKKKYYGLLGEKLNNEHLDTSPKAKRKKWDISDSDQLKTYTSSTINGNGEKIENSIVEDDNKCNVARGDPVNNEYNIQCNNFNNLTNFTAENPKSLLSQRTSAVDCSDIYLCVEQNIDNQQYSDNNRNNDQSRENSSANVVALTQQPLHEINKLQNTIIEKKNSINNLQHFNDDNSERQIEISNDEMNKLLVTTISNANDVHNVEYCTDDGNRPEIIIENVRSLSSQPTNEVNEYSDTISQYDNNKHINCTKVIINVVSREQQSLCEINKLSTTVIKDNHHYNNDGDGDQKTEINISLVPQVVSEANNFILTSASNVNYVRHVEHFINEVNNRPEIVIENVRSLAPKSTSKVDDCPTPISLASNVNNVHSLEHLSNRSEMIVENEKSLTLQPVNEIGTGPCTIISLCTNNQSGNYNYTYENTNSNKLNDVYYDKDTNLCDTSGNKLSVKNNHTCDNNEEIEWTCSDHNSDIKNVDKFMVINKLYKSDDYDAAHAAVNECPQFNASVAKNKDVGPNDVKYPPCNSKIIADNNLSISFHGWPSNEQIAASKQFHYALHLIKEIINQSGVKLEKFQFELKNSKVRQISVDEDKAHMESGIVLLQPRVVIPFVGIGNRHPRKTDGANVINRDDSNLFEKENGHFLPDDSSLPYKKRKRGRLLIQDSVASSGIDDKEVSFEKKTSIETCDRIKIESPANSSNIETVSVERCSSSYEPEHDDLKLLYKGKKRGRKPKNLSSPNNDKNHGHRLTVLLQNEIGSMLSLSDEDELEKCNKKSVYSALPMVENNDPLEQRIIYNTFEINTETSKQEPSSLLYKGKKRGRKPKSDYAEWMIENVNCSLKDFNTEEINPSLKCTKISDVEQEQSSLLYKGKKRGRKPKPVSVVSIIGNDDCSLERQKDFYTVEMNSTLKHTKVPDVEQKQSLLLYKGKKRGRKPKYALVVPIVENNYCSSEQEEKDSETVEINSSLECTKISDVGQEQSLLGYKGKKRGRKPKYVSVVPIVESDDYSLEQEEDSETVNSPLECTKISDVGQEQSLLYKGKKRGRKPKHVSVVPIVGSDDCTLEQEDSETVKINSPLKSTKITDIGQEQSLLLYKGKKRGRKPKHASVVPIVEKGVYSLEQEKDSDSVDVDSSLECTNVSDVEEKQSLLLHKGKKRGRKPKHVSIVPIVENDECSLEQEKDSDTVEINSSLKCTKVSDIEQEQPLLLRKGKKRGRKPKFALRDVYENNEKILTNTEKYRKLSLLRFLKDPLTLNCNLEDFTSTRMVQCGRCDKMMKLGYYKQYHCMTHYYLCWLKDEEARLNFENRIGMETFLKRSFKTDAQKNRTVHLVCSECNHVSKSPYGYVSHVLTCNRTKQCSVCGKIFSLINMNKHMAFHEKQYSRLREAFRIKNNSRKTEKEENIPPALYKIGRQNFSFKQQRGRSLRSRLKKKPARCSNVSHSAKRTGYREKVIENPNTDLDKLIPYWSLWETQSSLNCAKKGCTFECMKSETLINHFRGCQLKLYQYLCNRCSFYTNYLDIILLHEKNCSRVLTKTEIDTDVSDDEVEDQTFDSMQDNSSNTEEESDEENSSNSDCSFNEMKHDHRVRTFTSFMQIHFKNIDESMSEIIFRNRNLRQKLFSSPLSLQIPSNEYVQQLLTRTEAEQYLPVTKRSMFISITNQSQFQRFNRFESKIDNDVTVIFVGGPVWSLSWAPKSDACKNSDEYLSVYCHPYMDQRFQNSKCYNFCSLIQIWKIPGLYKTKRVCEQPRFYLGIAHEFGVVWQMEWCPSRHSNKCLDDNSNIGILAAATSSGFVPIYSVPKIDLPSSEEQDWKIFKLEPGLILKCLDEPVAQCTRISWEKSVPHTTIIGGFSDGTVAMWQVNTNSVILKNGKTIYPFRTFLAHSAEITALSIHILDGCRYLLTGSSDRLVHCWDLDLDKNLTNFNTPAASFNKGSYVVDSVWMPYSLSVLTIYDYTYRLMESQCIMYSLKPGVSDQQVRTLFPKQNFLRCASISAWTNSLAVGSFEGPVYGLTYNQMTQHVSKRGYEFKPMLLADMALTPRSTIDSKLDLDEDEVQADDDPSSYNYALNKYAIELKSSKKTGKDSSMKKFYLLAEYPSRSVNKICWNPNYSGFNWLAVGYHNGFVRLTCTDKIHE